MTRHDLKCWPQPFSAVWDGRKRFEVRRDDRGFSEGDSLLLREWLPRDSHDPGEYTGREVLAEVTYLTRGPNWGLPINMVVMGIAVVRRSGVER